MRALLEGLGPCLLYTSTAYRKITGKVAFTVPEVQLCKELLDLDAPTTNAIFFAADLF